MENIKTLIRLKRDFNTKYLDIQANMALWKIEEEKFEIDTFYAYDNEGKYCVTISLLTSIDKLMPISHVITNLMKLLKNFKKQVSSLNSSLTKQILENLIEKLSNIKQEDTAVIQSASKVDQKKLEKKAFESCYNAVNDLDAYKIDLIKTKGELLGYKDQDHVKEKEREFLIHWKNKKNKQVTYEGFIQQLLPGEVEVGFKRELEQFNVLLTKLRKLVRGTNYEFLTELDSVTEDLKLACEVISTNNALIQVLSQLPSVPSMRYSLSSAKSSNPSTMKSAVSLFKSTTENDILFQAFDRLSSNELDSGISNENFIFIVDKIERDYDLMIDQKLWRTKEQRIDEECWDVGQEVDIDESFETQSLTVSFAQL